MEINTEQEILKAAKKLFMEKGFAMTSTADIAREAGCNTAMIHYYFRTKDRLFEEVFAIEATRFATRLAIVPTEGLSFEESLTRMIDMHFEFLSNSPRFVFLMMNELITNPSRMESIKKVLIDNIGGLFTILQGMIDKAVEHDEIRPIKAVDLMLNIGSLNAMPHLMLPIIQDCIDFDPIEFLESRRRNIIETIINSLKK